MGCGASNAASGDVSHASPIIPDSGHASHKPSGKVAAAAAGISASAASQTGGNVELQMEAMETYHAACKLFSSSSSAAPSIPSSLDSVCSSFVGELDIGTLIEYFTATSGGNGNQLFSETEHTLELSQANVAELVLVAGESSEALRLLRAMDTAGEKYDGMLELPAGMQAKQASEAESDLLASALPSPAVKAALECRAILAAQTCTLHHHAKLPSVATAAAGAVQDEDAELDINLLNGQLLGTRTRLQFLHPNTLVYIVAAGSGGIEGVAGQAATILRYLALSEQIYDSPSELVKGVNTYRLEAAAKRATLESKSAAGNSTDVPADLQQQIAPLQNALLVIEPSCTKLETLMEPLNPTLVQLTPTMRHLQAYLSRFLPLLKEARATALKDKIQPEEDATTAQILSAYLIPFIKLMQPWIVQLRPYLSGLQPFFTELQPFLGQTHGAFSLLQPFLVTLQPHVSSDSAFLLSPSFHPFLTHSTHVLSLVHPLLKQLHPLMEGLLEFCREVGRFLVELGELLELLQAYQTLPLELDDESTADASNGDRETSKSSIARPWFAAGSSRPSSAAQQSAPRFLAKYGKFIGKIVPYVQQLRPFVDDVKSFVEKFVPYVGQLAPFYHTQLKTVVTPLLLCLVPQTERPSALPDSKEMDDAALQRLLSS